VSDPYGDLEIALRWKDPSQLDVGLRFVLSDRNVDDWASAPPMPLDLAALARAANQPEKYAASLSEMLFGSDGIKEFYARSRASSADRPLHVRLFLDGPPELHRIRWELLSEPTSGSPLTTTSDVLFSRYLSSPDFRVVPWRSQRPSRALAIIAAPTDIEDHEPGGRRLAAVNLDVEKANAAAALGDLDTTWLDGGGRATLANIAEALASDIDIVLLVCHGALLTYVPVLFLERPDGTAHVVDGRRLQETVFALPRRPTLALLSSCQSVGTRGAASSADEGVLAGLGPRLAAAGIATVIAMQGNVTMESARLFGQRFFEELRGDGLVDRSVASARRLLRERDRADWWVPVLFSRLGSGRSYFNAEFTGDAEQLWSSLETAQSAGRLIPVVGPGMTDEILGPRDAIAARWADQRRMPIAQHTRDDLAKVAQYLRVQLKAPGDVALNMAGYLQQEIRERVAKAESSADSPFHGVDPTQRPEQAILEAGRRLLQDEGNAYRVVAAMPLPLFVTTNWTRLLEQALASRTPPRQPTTLYFPWNDRVDWPDTTPTDQPDEQHPLVYHLFGSMEEPDSLVITEDDYLEWLTAWVAKRELIPSFVTKNLVNRSLLFLGYQFDDWEFRAVFQAIKSIPSSASLLPRHTHVGVQLSPTSHEVEPEAAQDYLESYFKSDNVGIYWSDTRQFLDAYRAQTRLQT